MVVFSKGKQSSHQLAYATNQDEMNTYKKNMEFKLPRQFYITFYHILLADTLNVLPASMFSTPTGAMPVRAVLKFCRSTRNALIPLDRMPNTPGSP